MKTYPDIIQGSVQWLEARAGVVTASEAKELLTDKLAARNGQMVETLLARKLAERWLGPLPNFSSFATEQGQILEQSAFDCYAFEHDSRIQKVGFITTDDGRCGCSPDGITPDYGVEIKSLQPVHHVKCLMGGELPEEYAAQVHFSLWVTGLPEWKLFLYHRRLPHLLLSVEPEREIIANIGSAITSFNSRFAEEWAKIVERNGGPPPERVPFVPSSPTDPRAELFAGVGDGDIIP
jgi:hypothetical protein